MRKKEMLELNNELFERCEKFHKLYLEEKKKNEDLAKKIEELKATVEALRKENNSTPLKNLEKKVISRVSVSKEADYGASVIGKIVVKSTDYCNRLTANRDSSDNKELVNLILGRTEIAKAEILKAVNSDIPFENKIKLIDECKQNAEDYFLSVMAQFSSL